MRRGLLGFLLSLAVATAAHAQVLRLKKLDAKAPKGKVEVRGVGAGEFDPKIWQENQPQLVPDIRHPLLEPRAGKFRNIYAPSVLAVENGYRIFYGGWDGAPTGNDRIYSVQTSDFRDFIDRQTVIEHGPFQHVCNVNVTRTPRGLAMMCTVFPDSLGKNKPAVFFDSNPRAATFADIIQMDGYPGFAASDINGCSVLVHDGTKFRLYFNNFAELTKTFRATSDDGRRFTFDGPVCDGSAIVNDVKLFRTGSDTWYLMGFHHNGESLMYSLSRDPMKCPAPRVLLKNLNDVDKYIVSLGFVTRDNHLLGLFYGAGATPALNANRIFARWFQKRLVWLGADGVRIEASGGLGPDVAVFGATGNGAFEFRSNDGQTLRSPGLKITAGDVLQLTTDN